MIYNKYRIKYIPNRGFVIENLYKIIGATSGKVSKRWIGLTPEGNSTINISIDKEIYKPFYYRNLQDAKSALQRIKDGEIVVYTDD